jgi:cell fate regulator YaaT (PSP1 superfamily)
LDEVFEMNEDVNTDGDSIFPIYTEKIKVVSIITPLDPKPVFHLGGALRLIAGTRVVIKTDGYEEAGVVSDAPRFMEARYHKTPLPEVIRKFTEEDEKNSAAIEGLENRAFNVCQKKIAELKLPMKLTDVKYSFSKKKGTFLFSADGRVDFRRLVKALSENFSIRVEMRQIGVRDDAALKGGCGDCGRELCCSTYMKNFDPVSVRMAKDQNLSLNPTKLSGQCGRLKCCLRFEHAHYVEVKRRLPAPKKRVSGCSGPAMVIRQDILAEEVTLALEGGERITVHANDLERMANGQYKVKSPIGG